MTVTRIKKLRVFAGPNGSGKSTLFQEVSKEYNVGFFVNADEIKTQIEQSGLVDLTKMNITATSADLDNFKTQPQSLSLSKKAQEESLFIGFCIKDNFIVKPSKEINSYEAAFIAAFIRHLLVANSKSFSVETVMSHPSKVDEIVNAVVDLGYKVYLYFVCIDDPAINISRIQNRIEKGGHEVPQDKVLARYSRTLENLHLLLPHCHRVYLFDNSGEEQKLIAEIHKEAMELKTDKLPNWFIKFVLPYYSS